MRLDPIVIRPYDEAWPGAFEHERQRVAAVLAPWTTRPIEHIGSTAVRALPAKPIIDMLAIVADIDAAQEATTPMQRIGWRHAPEPFDAADRKLSFCYPSVERRTHHLHVVEERMPDWRDWLAFRDYLRSHPDVAQEYAELKQDLARQYGQDPNERAAYRAGKAEFIQRVTNLAHNAVPRPQTAAGEIEALADQLDELINLVAGLSHDEFARPTRCPGWSVAEVIAHCEGMLVRLVGENARPVGGVAEIDRVGYYGYDPDGPREGEDPARTFSEVIRDRVIEEAEGRSPVQLRDALLVAVESALKRVVEIPAERVIQRSGHPRMTFGEFVASRNLEFGVHTLDIAQATGRPEQLRPHAAAIITDILDRLLGEPIPASIEWDATTYALVGTGRRPIHRDEVAAIGPLAARFPLLR